MDTELRQAERSGDYQRMYAILNRCGRSDEARNLILDHPINIDCVVQYRYRISWNYPDEDFPYGNRRSSLKGYDLDQLIEEFILENVGAAQIFWVHRLPVFQILGSEIEADSYSGHPLKAITLTEEETQALKERISSHPNYLQNATAEQLADAAEAYSRDAERAQRKIKQERERAAAQKRKQDVVDNFEHDSSRLRQEVWALWLEHGKLPRPEFARAVGNHSLRYVLFKLKDIAATYTDTYITELEIGNYFAQLWADSYQKRLGIWKRANLI
jgi:hypothetical protein